MVSGQMLLFTAMSLAVVALAAVLVLFIWRLRRAVETLERRLDESLRQVEMTAEELRKTNATVREILEHARKSAANVEHVTEGVRGLRKTLDAATSVADLAVVPVLGNVAAGMAGVRAAVAHLVHRHFGKGDRP